MTERYYYESVEVLGTANSETLETILTSTEEEHKFIDALAFTETTATHQRNAEVVAYIEREKIMDVPLYLTLIHTNNETRIADSQWFKLGHDLPVGQSLRVGHVSAGAASNVSYTVRYKIEE